MIKLADIKIKGVFDKLKYLCIRMLELIL